MATLGQVSDVITKQLRARTKRLLSALEDDATDFTEIVESSKAVAELAGTISDFYGEIEQMLQNPLQGSSQPEDDEESPTRSAEPSGDHNQDPAGHNGSDQEEVTKEELLERAREMNVHGRSSMSKDELAAAVEAEENLTKDELLERARQAGIEGRSSMSKDELRAALRDADS
jgi:hypothetical protein